MFITISVYLLRRVCRGRRLRGERLAWKKGVESPTSGFEITKLFSFGDAEYSAEEILGGIGGSWLSFLREALQLIQYLKLTRTGRTSWDEALNLRVVHRSIGDGRIVSSILILLAILYGMTLVFTPAS